MFLSFRNRPGLVVYLTAGDPDLATTREIDLAASTRETRLTHPGSRTPPTLSRTGGILPALESAHAVAEALKLAPGKMAPTDLLMVNLSGRGDKDMGILAREMKLGSVPEARQ